MTTSNAGEPRGVLNLKAGEKKFNLSRHLPAEDLTCFVENHWIVDWDLRGQKPYVAETLPHPSVCLVFERGESRIIGVVTGKFTRRLEGPGRVFGIKFKPGAFYPFVQSPVSEYTDRVIDMADVFGAETKTLREAILSSTEQVEMIEHAESFLRRRFPEPDGTVALINRIVDRIIADRDITRVDHVVSHFNLSKRTLQRIFHAYVGVSPKWVIRRYRLHEATEKMAAEVLDWPRLALDLGYFDQAHFIKDFKAIVGQSPTEYTRKVSLSP